MATRSRHHKRTHDLIERDGRRCIYCDAALYCSTCEQPTGGAVPATKDHVIPEVLGGTFALDNLALACSPCNEAKGATIV